MSQINDCQLAYFQANGATSNSLQDASLEFLLAAAVPLQDINDMWSVYFAANGFTGIISDDWVPFWVSVGCLVEQAPMYPLVFDEAVAWLDETTHIGSPTDITTWRNKGLGGVSYDLDTIINLGGSNFVEGSINGLPTFRTTGNRKINSGLNGTTHPAPHTILLVLKIDTPTASPIATIFDQVVAVAGGDRLLSIQTNSPIIKMQNGAGGNPPGYPTRTTVDRWFYENDSVSADVVWQIANEIPQPFTAGTGVNWLGMFANSSNNNPNDVTIDMCEMLLIPRILTAQERLDVDAHFNTKWGANV
ncbi:MAG: hypothetical protein ACC707_20200 [Thiohalomonadales bacterium]